MACLEELPVYDKGTSLLFYIEECDESTGEMIPVDIAGATLTIVFLKFEKGTVDEKPGTIYAGGTNGDSTDGIVEYITETDFIDAIGSWKAQAVATFSPTQEYQSTEVEIEVVATLRHPAE